MRKPMVAIVNVFYGTNRAPTGDKALARMYGAERATRNRFGVCRVSVPVRHHMPGVIERPNLYKLQVREDPARHFVVLGINELSANEFGSRAALRLDHTTGRQAFVLVHGFRTSFVEATMRAAQIAHDLRFDGVPFVFSWPTMGETSLAAYRHDETNAEASIEYCRQFLAQVIDRTDAEKIHLIAHSMGNKVLTAALQQLKVSASGRLPVFNQIILAAPDIDADVFKDTIAPAIRGVGVRTTLYAARNDRALWASKKLHGDYKRAGYIDVGLTPIAVDTPQMHHHPVCNDVRLWHRHHSFRAVVDDARDVGTPRLRVGRIAAHRISHRSVRLRDVPILPVRPADTKNVQQSGSAYGRPASGF